MVNFKNNKKGETDKDTLLVASMGTLLFLFLLLILGLAFTPQVANLSNPTNANLTGVSAVLFNFVPLFWVVLIIGIVGVVAFNLWGNIKE